MMLPGIYLAENAAGDRRIHFAELRKPIGDDGARCGMPAADEYNGINYFRQKLRVRDCQDWRRIENDEIKALPQPFDQVAHCLRAQQIHGVWDRAPSEHHMKTGG